MTIDALKAAAATALEAAVRDLVSGEETRHVVKRIVACIVSGPWASTPWTSTRKRNFLLVMIDLRFHLAWYGVDENTQKRVMVALRIAVSRRMRGRESCDLMKMIRTKREMKKYY